MGKKEIKESDSDTIKDVIKIKLHTCQLNAAV